MGKPKTLGWVGASLLALSLAVGYAVADTSADKNGPPKAGKGKAGDPCKVNTDCDQSARPQFCRESKCEFAPVHKVT